jgi:hypothetical protein
VPACSSDDTSSSAHLICAPLPDLDVQRRHEDEAVIEQGAEERCRMGTRSIACLLFGRFDWAIVKSYKRGSALAQALFREPH